MRLIKKLFHLTRGSHQICLMQLNYRAQAENEAIINCVINKKTFTFLLTSKSSKQ